MKGNEKNSKKFLALLLSLLMATSVTVAFSSCDEDEEETDTSTETETETEEDDEEVVVDDNELIINSTFALNAYDAAKPVVTSMTGWTKTTNSVSSGTAPSSDAASGIIDVDEDKWKDLTTSGIDVSPAELTEEQAAEKWSVMTTKDKLEYYEAWKDDDANDDRKITDLDFYESFNIDVDDLPLVEDADGNKTALANPEARPESEDSRVLMIHNEKKTDTYIGTAQKMTSSSTVTVKAGETAKFSVWVKTSELVGSSANNEEDTSAYNKGAYILINHTVGGKTLEPLEIKNINVDAWTKYEFVLSASSFADSTFSMVLGLGQSGGTNKEEYVNGYAFFDDISCEIVSESVSTDGYETFNFGDEDNKTVYANKTDAKQFALDFYEVGSGFGALDVSDLAGKATTEKNTSGVEYSTVDGVGKLIPALTAPLNTTSDLYQAYNLANLASGDDTQKAVYNNYFADDDFLGDSNAFLFLSKNGAAYKADKTISVPAGYSAISFYVKTSEMKGHTGAGIKLVFDNEDFASAQEIASLDTTTVVEEDSDTDGWQQIFFFFDNKTESTQTAKLTLSFGPTSGLISATKSSFFEGFAAFANFQSKVLDKAEFDCAASGSYTKIVTVEEPEEEIQTDSGFDAAGSLEQASIKDGFAKTKNYTGVYSDSAFIGGGSSLESNKLATAGLLNKQYAATKNYNNILEKIGGTGATWNSLIGNEATQPLVIYNETASDKSYGFIGASTTISASTYKTISMRVKVSAGATANIYLIDMDDDNYNNALSIERKVTYWYDKDGNVCAKDPTDTKNFNSKTDVAFKLQKNGLYKVNPNWSGAAGVDTETYFANLAAYEYDADSKNLMLDDLATDYEYSDNWKHDGNDRVAFYNYDEATKSAYAYSNNETKVYDFSTVSALSPRYAAEEAKDLHFTIGDTNGEWITVTFYIHTGENAKNYRLELWNGAREGSSLTAGSYVMFDSWTPDDLNSTTWATMLDEKEDGATKFESVFSFYDSAKYFRYDETIDDNKVGNSYESYDATAYTESVIYLESADKYTVFADYSPLETAVSKDAVEEETEEEEEETDENETNAWLLASSIAIAAVLVLTVMSLILRKAIARRRKKRGIVVEKTKKAKKEKKSKKTK
ncbi:MAG: hypothetical protein IJY05_02905 [Clostridia bacterium]|nr:hypothetical protein [Clostridia bacterium]